MEKPNSFERNTPEIGVYEYYKSTPEERRYYQVIGFANHTETDEVFAIYVPLYGPEDEAELQARPLAMFAESVEHNGEIVPRFRYAEDER